jgi:hypothetical protein
LHNETFFDDFTALIKLSQSHNVGIPWKRLFLHTIFKKHWQKKA